MTGAVGLIIEPAHANEIITGGDPDLVFIARELLREPSWADIKGPGRIGCGAGLADLVRLCGRAASEVKSGLFCEALQSLGSGLPTLFQSRDSELGKSPGHSREGSGGRSASRAPRQVAPVDLLGEHFRQAGRVNSVAP